MKIKKTEKANLNNYSTTFMLLGLFLALFLSWMTLENKTIDNEKGDDEKVKVDVGLEEENVEVNLENVPPPPPPPPAPAPPEEMKIEEDEKEVEETVIESTETDASEEIQEVEEIDVAEEVEETDVEVAFQFIQNPPIYPGCEGKKGAALKKCMTKKITKFVNNNFDAEIAADLGLSGRVRIMTQFTIDKSGKVTNIKARSKYKDLVNEAKRVIKKLPKMKPGQQRNRPVKVTYTLPIIFAIED